MEKQTPENLRKIDELLYLAQKIEHLTRSPQKETNEFN